MRPSQGAFLFAVLVPIAARAAPAAAQQAARPDSTLLTVERIYASAEFRGGSFGPLRWLEGGSAYATLERSAGPRGGRDIVRYDTETGAREVMVPAASLIPPGDTVPLAIDGYAFSSDSRRLLIFTNSQRVWRTNTRGDYWVLDRASGRLFKLGGDAAPSTLMFAKFSPDGSRVGYVRGNNLYVEGLAEGTGRASARIRQLSRDGSRTIINGTFDWVYEEELDLRDGWLWSPDGRMIAYWQLDASGVRDFTLINDTDSLYSFSVPVQYPKAGETNSAARIGVVDVDGGSGVRRGGAGATRWLALDGDPRNQYPARMAWVAEAPRAGATSGNRTGGPRTDTVRGGPGELVIQRLNRLQNTLDLLAADPRTGAVRTILTERDSAWVGVVDALSFVQDGGSFLWMSERSGWNHLYVVSRDARAVRPITAGAFDVLGFEGVDEGGGYVYYIASPDSPTERYLFRSRLDGTGRPERLSPASQSGSHGYDVAPNFRYAVHTYSRADLPPVIQLVRLPSHEVLRTLVDNAQLRSRVAALRRRPTEFFQVDVGDGVRLNAWMIKPPDFDSTRRYPVLFYVYGGPGSQTVLDGWGGSRYLWHLLLAQRGTIVASVDNRGTGARGREWRKIVYRQLGVVETRDQAAAARAIGRFPYVDSTRLGIWGWSYGGFLSLNALFQHPEVYRAAVAVAPVTHWKFYDTIYTERYNGLPQDNAAGYDRGSPLSYADRMRGSLLVVHGTGDDNVHFQNTEALVNTLVAANQPFTLMAYPNRNHGISGGNTSRHLFELITRYVEEKL